MLIYNNNMIVDIAECALANFNCIGDGNGGGVGGQGGHLPP